MKHHEKNDCRKDDANQDRGDDVVPAEELEREQKINRLLKQPIREFGEIFDEQETYRDTNDVKDLQNVFLQDSVGKNNVCERKKNVVNDDVHLVVGKSCDFRDPPQERVDDLKCCIHSSANV